MFKSYNSKFSNGLLCGLAGAHVGNVSALGLGLSLLVVGYKGRIIPLKYGNLQHNSNI